MAKRKRIKRVVEAQSYDALKPKIIEQVKKVVPSEDFGPWVAELFDEYVIVEVDYDEFWKIPYTLNGDEPTIASKIEWERVERDDKWINKTMEARRGRSRFVLEADLTPTQPGDGFAGREWEITVIGARSADDVIEVDGQQYIKSKNGRLYAVTGLQESVPLWDGAQVYDNHLTDREFEEKQGMRSVLKEGIGGLVNPRWISNPLPKLVATFKVIDEAVATKLKNAWDAGILEKIAGFSIDAFTRPGPDVVIGGERWPTMAGISEAISLDLVGKPAAGGGFNRLIASEISADSNGKTKPKELDMDEKELAELISQSVATALKPFEDRIGAIEAGNQPTEPGEPEADPEATPDPTPDTPPATPEPAVSQEAYRRLECRQVLFERLTEAKLSANGQKLVRQAFANRIFETKELDDFIKTVKEGEAQADPSGRVTEANSQRQRIIVGSNEADRLEVEFLRLAMRDSDFRALDQNGDVHVKTRLSESHGYQSWVKDGRPRYGTMRMSNLIYETLGGNPFIDERAYEAVTTSTLSSAVKNALNVMLAASYSVRRRWWEPLVRTEEVDTIDQATLVRDYGVNTLSVVNEGNAYTALTMADEEETASFVKKGNYIGVTLETLINDKINEIRRIPTILANSWYNTLSSLVSGVFTVNSSTGPVLSDSGALFNATAVASAGGHANLLTAALSYTAYDAARTAMKKQTDQPSGAGQRLIAKPRYILVPVDLASTAEPIFNTQMKPGSSNNDINPFYQECDIVEVPEWTDANDWALMADPMTYPSIWLIFLRGGQVPSIFTSDQETQGAMFTNDELRYKVRMMTWRFSSSYECAPVSDFRGLHKSNVT